MAVVIVAEGDAFDFALAAVKAAMATGEKVAFHPVSFAGPDTYVRSSGGRTYVRQGPVWVVFEGQIDMLALEKAAKSQGAVPPKAE